MMRILQITEAASAGVGRHLIDLVEGLDAHGCETHVVYSPGRMDETFAARLADLPVATAEVSMRRAPSAGDVRAWRTLRSYLRAHGPFDIIHAQSTKAGLLARALPKCGAKVVYTPHCIYTMNPTAGRLAYLGVRAVERACAVRTDAIIAVSPDEQEHITRDLRIPSEKVRCIVNGVSAIDPCQAHGPRAALGLPEARIAVGFLGRLSPQKDPLNFIEAGAAVLRRGRKIHLAIAGTGDLESDCRRRVRELGIEQHTSWLGYRTAAEMMPNVDIFTMSSRYEGMPYTLLEALASARPIITTDVGGARLAVEHGENGFVVPVGDSSTLARRIEQLADSPDMREEFSAASLRRAKRFTIQHMVQQTLELYTDLARSEPKRPGGSVLARAEEAAMDGGVGPNSFETEELIPQ